MQENGLSAASIEKTLRYFQDDCKLPFFVATMPLKASEVENTNIESQSKEAVKAPTSAESATMTNLEFPLSKEEVASDERVVGYAFASPYQDKTSLSGYYKHAVEVRVYVAPNYLRRGIGTSLVNVIIARLKTLCCVPEEEPSLSREEGPKASVPRFKEALAIMPVRKGASTEEVQKGFWGAAGVEEVGR